MTKLAEAIRNIEADLAAYPTFGVLEIDREDLEALLSATRPRGRCFTCGLNVVLLDAPRKGSK